VDNRWAPTPSAAPAHRRMPWRNSPRSRPTKPAAGAMVFAHACKLGLEGIVSKRVLSRYRSGTSRNRLKCLNPEFERRRETTRTRSRTSSSLPSRSNASLAAGVVATTSPGSWNSMATPSFPSSGTSWRTARRRDRRASTTGAKSGTARTADPGRWVMIEPPRDDSPRNQARRRPRR
jgi:hypothetical protein